MPLKAAPAHVLCSSPAHVVSGRARGDDPAPPVASPCVHAEAAASEEPPRLDAARGPMVLVPMVQPVRPTEMRTAPTQQPPSRGTRPASLRSPSTRLPPWPSGRPGPSSASSSRWPSPPSLDDGSRAIATTAALLPDHPRGCPASEPTAEIGDVRVIEHPNPKLLRDCTRMTFFGHGSQSHGSAFENRAHCRPLT